MSNPAERAKTIDSKGEIVTKPYGPSRWANPRRRPCAHADCPNDAKICARTGAHAVDDAGNTRAHNCCDDHDAA